MKSTILNPRLQGLVNYIKTIPGWNKLSLPQLIEILDKESIINPFWKAPEHLKTKVNLPSRAYIDTPLFKGEVYLKKETHMIWYESSESEMIISGLTQELLLDKIKRNNYKFEIIQK